MLAVHPIVQFLAILLALYVFCLGLQRFRFLHLQQKSSFRWKWHAALGKIALGLLLAGMLGGMVMVYVYWHGFLVMGMHGKVALAMVPFIIFGVGSGLYMDHKKKNRKLLTFIHGLNNLVVLALALTQVVSGWGIYRSFVLGG